MRDLASDSCGPRARTRSRSCPAPPSSHVTTALLLGGDELGQRDGVRPPRSPLRADRTSSPGRGNLRLLRSAPGIDDAPEPFGLRWRRVRVEPREIDRVQVGGDVLAAAAPRSSQWCSVIEVPVGEVRRVQLRPGREVTPVAGWKVDPDPLVTGEDDAGDVEDRVSVMNFSSQRRVAGGAAMIGFMCS